MKRIFCIIISILLLTVSLTSCTNLQAEETTIGEKEDIFSETDDEKAKEDASALFYSKEFLGGTGYKTDSLGSHYEYDGGEMSIDYAIGNGYSGFECGLFVILDGVFQTFTLKTSDNEETDEAYMHIIDVPDKTEVIFTVTFTPNIGKKGDELNIAVGMLIEPSYRAEYTGWGRYGKYGELDFDGSSGMSVFMNCDGTGTRYPVENPEISKTEITDKYFDKVTVSAEMGEENEEWKNTYLFALYYDEYNFEKDLIAVPETDSVKLKLDIMGKEAQYRITIFVNNEILEFEDGATYFEIQTTTDNVTHIEFPVDISDLPNDSHIYAVIAEKITDESNFSYNTFEPCYHTRPCYFIKGEVPEITTNSEADVTEEETAEQNTAANISEGEIAALSGMSIILYAASVDSNTLCFVVQDENDNKKAVFVNKEDNTVISETALSENADYYSVACEKLIAADSTITEDGAYWLIDKSGNVTDKKPYVINSAAEKESGKGSGSESVFSVISNMFKKVAIDGDTGDMIYIADNETYFIDGSTGEKTRLDFFSGENTPSQIRSFADGNMLIVKTGTDGSFFTIWDTNGNKINEFSFPDLKDFTCVDEFTVIFTRKNQSGISADNKVYLLNSLTGEMKELSVETNKENQWCTVSSDGKYILTLDYDFNFRLYDTESGGLIEKFNIDGMTLSPFKYQVLIDSESKTVYLGLMNNNDVYGVYIKIFREE